VSSVELSTVLGPARLATPLVAASGTVGSVVELAEVTDFSRYGAAVAKSVSASPWTGRPAPRMAPAGTGMLNGVGIQNPGVDAWVADVVPRLGSIPTPVWGSAVGTTVDEFVKVASAMASAGVPAVELNLSCPNLDGHLFALDARLSAEVVAEVRRKVSVPVSAKLSPNSEDIVAVAAACADAGADWVVLTNTVWGAAIDLVTGRPRLSGTVGGFSGPPLKPIALRCVIEVHRALPDLPIIGCGGVANGDDAVEYLLAGASAVGIGTAHFSEPRVAGRVLSGMRRRLRRMKIGSVRDAVGMMRAW